MKILEKKFNPHQPRNRVGRWVDREFGPHNPRGTIALHLPPQPRQQRQDVTPSLHQFQWVKVDGERAVVTRIEGHKVHARKLGKSLPIPFDVTEHKIEPIRAPTKEWRDHHGIALDGAHVHVRPSKPKRTSHHVFNELITIAHDGYKIPM